MLIMLIRVTVMNLIVCLENNTYHLFQEQPIQFSKVVNRFRKPSKTFKKTVIRDF